MFGRSLCFALTLATAIASAAGEPDLAGVPLSLSAAREIALRNHPDIAAADYSALAAEQAVKEARAAYFPQANINGIAVATASDSTNIMAGSLSNSSVYNRVAGGLSVTQLITDFGRTASLVASARYQSGAKREDTRATRQQILLQVDKSFFDALRARAVSSVARQTFDTRKLLLDKITALAANKLRSDLDVSFAQIAVEEGRLLIENAANDERAAMARLVDALGSSDSQLYQLVEPAGEAPVAVGDVTGFIADALRQRPELISLRNQHEAAVSRARAERDAQLPKLSLVGATGEAPSHDSRLNDGYAAGGIEVSVPLFAGGLYRARQREAEFKARSDEENLRAARNAIIRDVRIAWLNLSDAVVRLRTTEQLVDYAGKAFDLASARYRAGISSIVELSQAQLSLTSAQIQNASAKYDVLVQRSNLAYQTGSLP